MVNADIYVCDFSGPQPVVHDRFAPRMDTPINDTDLGGTYDIINYKYVNLYPFISNQSIKCTKFSSNAPIHLSNKLK